MEKLCCASDTDIYFIRMYVLRGINRRGSRCFPEHLHIWSWYVPFCRLLSPPKESGKNVFQMFFPHLRWKRGDREKKKIQLHFSREYTIQWAAFFKKKKIKSLQNNIYALSVFKLWQLSWFLGGRFAHPPVSFCSSEMLYGWVKGWLQLAHSWLFIGPLKEFI